jgi:hypothetical protein
MSAPPPGDAFFRRSLHGAGGLSRRELLLGGAQGFGALALSALLADRGYGARSPAAAPGRERGLGPGAALDALHHPARAERVIFLYMDGGPSQVDTFDPKPRLQRENGRPIGMEVPRTQFDDVGSVLASPWAFRRHGECGLEVSDLFPHVGAMADRLCVVRSMTSRFPEHTFANYFLHTGHGLQGRPSMGSWISYGLGSACRDLPGYVVLNGGLTPPGGLDNFGSGFLPAAFQGSVFRGGERPVANASPVEGDAARQRAKLELLGRLDGAGDLARDREVEAAIANYELAARMQAAVPELCDLSGESKATRDLYGLEDEFEHTRTYARQCLLARRLVERGVRFVQLTCPPAGRDRWDQHDNLKEDHERNARAVDRPIAGLLRDLESRGLLDTTLVLWAGEFGRTPMAQGTTGRDHNPHGYTIWMAGGGIRAGTVYGATDEYGYFAVEGRMTMYDLHATILHLLGVDHERLTVRFSGRDMRLTDVHGEVVRELLA